MPNVQYIRREYTGGVHCEYECPTCHKRPKDKLGKVSMFVKSTHKDRPCEWEEVLDQKLEEFHKWLKEQSHD